MSNYRSEEKLLADWLAACEGLSRHSLLQSLNLGPRLLRLFAVACCDDIVSLMKDERSVRAARVAELHGGRLERRKEAAHAGDAAAQIWELVLAAPMAPNPGAAEAGR